MLIQTKREDQKAFGRRPFIILRTYPSLAYADSNDRGIAALNCLDHLWTNEVDMLRSLPN